MIDPAEAIDALLQELRRQKAAGVRRVSVSEESLAQLKSLSGDVGSVPVASQVKPAAVVTAPRASAATAAAPKAASTSVEKISTPPPVWNLPAGTKKEKMLWLENQVNQCAETRRHLPEKAKPLLGRGSLEAKVFIIGEAPNAEEIEKGQAFAGDAGDLLNKIITSMGLKEEDVYFSNLITWKPKAATPFGKRTPRKDEVEFGRPTLMAQLEIVKPKLIISAGAQALAALTGTDETITHKRGQWHELNGIPMMLTFHPSYLLNNPSMSSKRLVWEDFLLVMEKLGLPISAKQRSYFLTDPNKAAND